VFDVTPNQLQATAVSKLPCFSQRRSRDHHSLIAQTKEQLFPNYRLNQRRSLDRRLLSFDCLRKLAFVKDEFAALQSRFLRVAPDVAHTIREMLFVANEAIKIISLPK